MPLRRFQHESCDHLPSVIHARRADLPRCSLACMAREFDPGATPSGFGQEVRDWLEEAATLVAAAENQLSGARGSRAEALEHIRRARSLLDTVVEWSDESAEDPPNRIE